MVQKSKTLSDAIILGGLFVLTMENYGNPTEKAKVRYIAQEYKDLNTPFMVRDTATLHASSI